MHCLRHLYFSLGVDTLINVTVIVVVIIIDKHFILFIAIVGSYFQNLPIPSL